MENAQDFQRQIEILKNDLKYNIEFINKNPKAMAIFAFHLRVEDTKQAKDNNEFNHYTNKILALNAITSKIWKDIILSNKWVLPPEEEEYRMIVDPNVLFKMNLGELVFRCEDGRFSKNAGIKEIPYVVKLPDETLLEDISKYGFFRAWWKSPNKTQVWQTYQ